jgi:hypothetical protein
MAALALGVILAGSAWAAELLEEPPVYGAFYDRYEPSFYTGIGPRSDDARRAHPHLRSPVL